MKIGAKIMCAAAAAVILATAGAIGTVYSIARSNRVRDLRHQMSAALQQAEMVRSGMDFLHKNKAFDLDSLNKAAAAQFPGRALGEVYRETTLYRTIPVVSAWTSVEALAKQNHFEFLTPSRPGIPARNPKNNNGSEFEAAFNAFEAGADEFFIEDKAKDELILARPVHLAGSCMHCHGTAKESRSGDGLDLLGYPMEGMKVGDLKGAFVLKARMTQDPVVAASMKRITIVGLGVLALVLVGFHFLNRRIIIRPLSGAIGRINEASKQVASASAQIAAASQALAEGASEQAASLEETSASLEEMTSMVKRNSDSAQKAKALSMETRTAADTGAADMEEMKSSMDAIRISSGEVAKIVKNIDEIAFQTNILALNAAVEAARAGEAGAGFAVVADEVRNLAQRSAQAAKETADKIQDAIGKTNQGVLVSSKVANSFQEIIQKARTVDDLIGEIAAASQEQASGISQVNIAVTQMDKVTQGNAASAEESAGASVELNSQASSQRQAVAGLLELVGAGELNSEILESDGNGVPSTGTETGADRNFSANPRHGGGQAPRAPRSSGMVIRGLGERGDFASAASSHHLHRSN